MLLWIANVSKQSEIITIALDQRIWTSLALMPSGDIRLSSVVKMTLPSLVTQSQSQHPIDIP